jgi:hypothetical protein
VPCAPYQPTISSRGRKSFGVEEVVEYVEVYIDDLTATI